MDIERPIIEAQEVWKMYGHGEAGLEALKGASLRIAPGEIVSIMGPSGCGKTTLLNCLSGLDDMTRGRVLVEGADVAALPLKRRDALRAGRMGFIFQSYNLIPVLTAEENVELPLLCAGVRPKEAREKALLALSRVGLRERAQHRPKELSGGQQQRVAIARAIVNQPAIVWADEPTGALDSTTTVMVMDLIEHLNRTERITFVIVTHNPDVAAYADRTLYMDSGSIVDERGPASKRRAEGAAGGWRP
ncbi:ABC transporter ATP-binding protein [Paenibacillus sp.]|uniref:ABC transporter ATP-binding protein n=1 Tax=Paenibacillus sp. TaxID=58172 RepID=UPI002D35FD59|nr:ABC transporter ATP-binding protein [Paenibacillus sp.]HZG56152.1 ABC transporter ATP-binding protein [Paenibacillus sp.]